MPEAPAAGLATMFRSPLQGEILALLVASPDRNWTIDELARRTDRPYQTVATEVRRLEEVQLVRTHAIGRTKLLSADSSHPHHRPLAELVLMVFGPGFVVAEEFGEVDRIDRLMIHGAWATFAPGDGRTGDERVDLLVLGRPDPQEIEGAARRAAHRLARQVVTSIRTVDEWDTGRDEALQRLRSAPTLDVRHTPRDASGPPAPGATGAVGRDPALHKPLTPRQREVVTLLAAGYDVNAIASRLFLSVNTVRTYVKQLLRDLGARSQLEAVVVARKRNLIGEQPQSSASD